MILRAAIETASQDDGWASLGQVGNYLSKTHASFDPRNYGFTKLSALARAQDYLEVEQLDGRSPRVRLKARSAGQEGRQDLETPSGQEDAEGAGREGLSPLRPGCRHAGGRRRG